MNQISHTLHSPLGDHPALSNLQNSKTTQTALDVQVKKRMDVTFYTAEGDKVTLSSQAGFSAAYASYNREGELNGKTVQISAKGYSFSQEYTTKLTIKGDLSPDEIADLGKAFHEIEKLADHFFREEGDDLVKRIGRIMNLGSISVFDASLKYERSYSSIQTDSQTKLQRTNKPTEQVKAPPTFSQEKTLPSLSAPELRTAQAPPETSLASVQNPVPASEGAEKKDLVPETKMSVLVKKIEQLVDDSQVKRGKMTRHVFKFLDHLFEKLNQKGKTASPTRKLAKQIKTELINQLTASNPLKNHKNHFESNASKTLL